MTAATHHRRLRCWAEIDIAALLHNADALRALGKMELLAVVKANAYGHGMGAVVRALDGRAALFGVANLHEAEEVASTGTVTPVVLLGSCLPDEREAALRDGLHVSISSVKDAAAWNALAARLERTVRAHIVIDTGMGRMGIPEDAWNETTARDLLKFPRIQWEGLASHLPSADEDSGFTLEQITRFRKAVAQAHAAGLRPRWIHLDNSAGLLGFPQTAEFCNLARPGLALYGVSPLPAQQSLLKPVLTWKTRVILVRELPAGHGISYGRADILQRKSRIATLACGYADGYPRQVSGKGASVLINGHLCPLLGRVTMDQIMVDVTDLKSQTEVGDEAVLLGPQGDAMIPVEELAAQAGTIPWHIFTGITARVERTASDTGL